MGASAVTVRWQISTFECELLLAEGSGRVQLKREGAVVASTTVRSAVEAWQWVTTLVTASKSPKDREQTGTD